MTKQQSPNNTQKQIKWQNNSLQTTHKKQIKWQNNSLQTTHKKQIKWETTVN
jgi:hypothetical protein